ncbi:MAG: galactokinase [Oceanicoccus sp.]
MSDSVPASPREKVALAHRQHYSVEPQFIIAAPGRVNLIGEHTDYNDGFVLPLAINYHTAVSASKRDDRTIRAFALDEQSQVEISLDTEPEFDHVASWSNYLRGIIVELSKRGYKLCGADLMISGNVPQGAGLSSSAALEIALIRSLVTLSEESIDGVSAALVGQAAENNFVGCSCGIMDQLISAKGERQHALLIDCRSLTLSPVPLPNNTVVLVVNSNVKRKLVDGEYNLRRQQCEAVAKHLKVAALRDVSLDQLRHVEGEISDTEFRRARHVITENQRTKDTAQALVDGDLKEIGIHMAKSHASMRDDFEITVPEIDALVSIIKSVIGEQGGTRMTGGGFGGCVVSLFPLPLLSAVVEKVTVEYPKVTGIEATVFECEASQGAFT